MNNQPVGKSDIRIDAEGFWYYRNQEMTRRDIVGLFYQNLIRNDLGEYAIRIGRQAYPVTVEDTAYVVWDIRYLPETEDSEECIDLLLSDDSRELLVPETLRIGNNNIPYCSIRNGRHEARFSKTGYYRLAEYIDYDARHDGYYLELKNRRYFISDYNGQR